MARPFAVPLLPEGDEAQYLVGLLSLAEIGIGVAEDLAGAVLGEKGQHRLAPLAAARDVVLFHDRVLPEVGDRVEVEVERRGVDQALGAEPPPRCKKAVRPDPCRCVVPRRGGTVGASWPKSSTTLNRARGRLCARLDPEGLPPPTSSATAAGEGSRAGSVLRLLDHLGEVLLRRGVALPGRGPGLVRVLTAQLARFGDVCWLTRASPPLRVAPEALPL